VNLNSKTIRVHEAIESPGREHPNLRRNFRENELRLISDLCMAREVQQQLLQREVQNVPGVDLAAGCVPASELGSAVQHLYFIVAAPALFLPLGIILVGSRILPRVFGYLALVLAGAFAALGALFMLRLTLPASVTASAAVQALWWLAAGITLMVRSASLSALEVPAAG